jgi:hypothetical protein
MADSPSINDISGATHNQTTTTMATITPHSGAPPAMRPQPKTTVFSPI